MHAVYEFLVGLLCFISIPALLAIYFQLAQQRDQQDLGLTKTPYVRWLLSNPVGVVLIPLFTFSWISIQKYGLSLDLFTKPGISGNVLLTITFTGILLIANNYYAKEQEITKMNIVKMLRQELTEDRAESIRQQEKLQAELKHQQELAEQRVREEQYRAEERLKEQQARNRQEILDIYQELGRDVEALKKRWAEADS